MEKLSAQLDLCAVGWAAYELFDFCAGEECCEILFSLVPAPIICVYNNNLGTLARVVRQQCVCIMRWTRRGVFFFSAVTLEGCVDDAPRKTRTYYHHDSEVSESVLFFQSCYAI